MKTSQWLAEAVKHYVTQAEGRDLRELTIKRLASVFTYHPAYLARLFQRCSGTSLRQFIVQRRLEKANEIMTEKPGLSKSKLAKQVGYENTDHFRVKLRKKE